MNLSTTYYGGGVAVSEVEESIFYLRYVAECYPCRAFHFCCTFGVGVPAALVSVLHEHVGLEVYMETSKSEWFDQFDAGSRVWRTQTKNGYCVFFNVNGGGCYIHRYCVSVKEMDYRMLKPVACCLFPLTVTDRTLRPADLLTCPSLEQSLPLSMCRRSRVSLYQGVRDDLRFYFGPSLVAELDARQARESQ